MNENRTRQQTVILWVITGVIILFFAVIGGLALELRKQLRKQLISRDGEIFMVVASAEVDRIRALNDGIFPPGADEELFEVALNTSEIKGVIGVRVFKEGNRAVGGIPISLRRGKLDPSEEQTLKDKRPISRFHPAFLLGSIFLLVDAEDTRPESFPVLEIVVPLFSLEDEEVSGFAQYFLDGGDLQRELRAVDSNILTYAGGAFLLASLLAGGILYGAFRKLRLVNQLLEERTRNLISANYKLSMEARTAAIGAITSHLIHGLKSPLQGIRQFVSAHSTGEKDTAEDKVWQDAVETTDRMQGLINEVMEVLQDRGGGFSYQISGSEIASLAGERVLPYARQKGVEVKVEASAAAADSPLPNERGNLVILILVNLLRNAIDASRPRDTVLLRITSDKKDQLSFAVVDHGAGLPASVVENLFQPVTSSKQDGSGVGLSLCQELSRHLEGRLELAKTGPQGTTFVLTISHVS